MRIEIENYLKQLDIDKKINLLPIYTRKQIKPFNKQNITIWKIVSDNVFTNQINTLIPDLVYKYLRLKCSDLILELKSHAKKTYQNIEDVMKISKNEVLYRLL